MIIYLVSENHVSKYLGGNEVYTDSLGKNYLKLGHRVVYYSTNFDLKNFQYPLRPIFKLLLQLTVASPKNLSKTVIHLTGTSIYFPLISILGKINNVKVVWTFQAPTNHPNRLIKWLSTRYEWLMSKLVAITITTSNYSQNYLQSLNPFGNYKFVPLTLPYFINPPKNSKSQLRKELKLNINATYIITVAKLDKHHYYKGVDNLLRSLKNLPNNYQVIVIGGGELLNNYQELTQTLKLKDRVIFTGEIEETLKYKFLKTANIFVLPSTSHSEGFGLSVLEASFLGLPCIVTECVGAASYFKDNRIATIIPANNSQELHAAIINNTYPHNTSLNENPRSIKHHLFDPISMAQNTLKVYENLIS